MRRFGKINIVAVMIIVFCGISLMKMRLPKEVRQVSNDGIVATVEKVDRNWSKVSLEISLKKEDDTAFDEGEYVGIVECNSKSGESNRIDYKLSNDKKVLTYVIDRQLENRKKVDSLRINLKKLMVEEKGSEILKESIYDIYQQYPLKGNYKDREFKKDNSVVNNKEDNSITDSYDEQIEKNRNMMPLDDIEEFRIIGVGFDTNYDRQAEKGKQKKSLLYLRTRSEEHDDETTSEADIYKLYNEETGEEIYWIQSSSTAAADNKNLKEGIQTTINETYYELTNTEKLKYIKPIMDYTKREVISDGQWCLIVNTKPE